MSDEQFSKMLNVFLLIDTSPEKTDDVFKALQVMMNMKGTIDTLRRHNGIKDGIKCNVSARIAYRGDTNDNEVTASTIMAIRAIDGVIEIMPKIIPRGEADDGPVIHVTL